VGICIWPEPFPAKVLTLTSFKLIWAVGLNPNSTAIDCPVVLPPKLIGPDPFKAIIYYFLIVQFLF
jgi:hypothetical protein